jgi:hypothetical protein
MEPTVCFEDAATLWLYGSTQFNVSVLNDIESVPWIQVKFRNKELDKAI